MDLGIVSYAAIVIICYLVGMGIKCIPKIPNDLIPVCVGVSGLILGVVAFYLQIPDFPATDVLTAAAVGIVSGLTSTGIDQGVKGIKSITEKNTTSE